MKNVLQYKTKTIQFIGSIVFLIVFTCVVSVPLFLLSFVSVLAFFNYPFVYDLLGGDFWLPFFWTSIAVCVPPLFTIGFTKQYRFGERFMRLVEVQAFFYLLLILLLTIFTFYTLNVAKVNNLQAMRLIFYFAIGTKFLLWLYCYASIKVSLLSQHLSPPKNVAFRSLNKDTSLKEEFCFLDNNGTTLSANNAPLDENNVSTPSKNLDNERFAMLSKAEKEVAFTAYTLLIPEAIARVIKHARYLGTFLLCLAIVSPSALPFPFFLTSYLVFALFFLYFYVLTQLKNRPYAFWRIFFLWINVFLFIELAPYEERVWQMLLVAFFVYNLYVVYVLYKKSDNWFLE